LLGYGKILLSDMVHNYQFICGAINIGCKLVI